MTPFLNHLVPKMFDMMKSVKALLQRHWLLWMLVLLVMRPNRFMTEFVYAFIDYRLFRESIKPYRNLLHHLINTSSLEFSGSLLIVAGRGMNIQWLQIWTVLGAYFACKGYRIFVVTARNKPIQNLYLRIFGFTCLYLDEMCIEDVKIPAAIAAEFAVLESFSDFKGYECEGIPLGKMALSTFSRLRASGITDINDSQSRQEVRYWLAQIYKTMQVAYQQYKDHDISVLFFTEVFMEEYGAFYYAALNRNLNIIRFAGTVRDNAIVVQRLNAKSDRTHFSSISPQTWEKILSYPDSLDVDLELEQNFCDRYSDRWALSKRNQPNARILPVPEARALLGVASGSKIAVIYSHILYDTLFFNGEDIYDNYAEWLVGSVSAACANSKVQWFIKIHPSNLWRGELEHYHYGKYEEVRLIEKYVGELPDHVKLVYPDTPFSPLTWLQIADFGVTVRGTSGIELGALGKTVITAGSGRYEDIGFTLNSKSIDEYLCKLAQLPDIAVPTEYQTRLAKRFAYATFCMKPFTLDFLEPVTRRGKSLITSSDDLVFRGNFADGKSTIPESIESFTTWCLKKKDIDFLNSWPTQRDVSGRSQTKAGYIG